MKTWVGRLGGGCLGFRLDGHLDLGALLEMHLVAIPIDQSILDTKLSIEVIGPFHRDLRLVGYAGIRRLDDLFDSCRQSGTWLVAHRWLLMSAVHRPHGLAMPCPIDTIRAS